MTFTPAEAGTYYIALSSAGGTGDYTLHIGVSGTYGEQRAGTAGSDSIHGSMGGDDLYGYGGDGTDLGNDTIYGYAGNDRLWGDNSNDFLVGGDGSDQLYGDAGNDQLEGDDYLGGLPYGAQMTTIC